MKILVLNSGSSSIKFQLIETSLKAIEDGSEELLAKGLVENIGASASTVHLSVKDKLPHKEVVQLSEHGIALQFALNLLADPEKGAVKGMDEIAGVGHRIVHGGEKFKKSTIITKEVLESLHNIVHLAPLHNPHNLNGYISAHRVLPDVPHIAVFDTSFHQAMPPEAFLYGLPYMLYRRDGIRRYGFHGTSHRYLVYRVERLLKIPRQQLKIITCHLGNGCSIAAVRGGHSVDTSMGFTPLEGLIMGTRSGDVDVAAILHIMGRDEMTRGETTTLLNKYSGLLGISGISNDMRDLLAASANGDYRADLAIGCFCYRIKKYIASYLGVLNGADAIAIAGGIGENCPQVRARSLKDMDYMGIRLSQNANAELVGREGRIDDGTGIPVFVVPTNEELVIARDTVRCIEGVI